MPRSVSVFFILVALVVVGPSAASGQAYVFAGGGVTIPSNDFGEYADAGWTSTAGVLVPIGTGLLLGGQGFYGRNGHQDIDGDRTDLLGAMGLIYRTFGAPDGITPFASLGAGYMKHSFKSESTPAAEGSDSGFAINGGVGVEVPLGSLRGFVSGIYFAGFGPLRQTRFVAANVGIGFPLGGGM